MIESDSEIIDIQLKTKADNILLIILLIVFIILGMVIGIVISKQRSAKREIPDSIAKEKERLEKLTQQISEEQAKMQTQPQGQIQQVPTGQKIPIQEKPKTPEESQILKDIQERGMQKPKIKIQTEVKPVEKSQKTNEPIVFEESATPKQGIAQQPAKVVIEKPKDQSGKPINQELAQLFDKIEQTTLKLLFLCNSNKQA
jgi:hypothetical protein